ncbi:hypothetical protein VNI00_010004 [Paramarasmius palmivorus]|uniref:F-box domain-containing protein n=1 Tax=Paramarasmius palmivorus TaxID=297713 RepID=A0AAW0CMQ2_9AGAR
MTTPKEQLQTVDKNIIEAEERVSKAKEDLRKLQSQHNSLIPICRLPNEVLNLIFISCVIDSEKLGGFKSRMVDSKLYSTRFSWIWVTHVCRHWREVALNCPAMWSTPLFDKPSLALEMLARARYVPLRIHVVNYNILWNQEVLLKEVVQDMTRVGELHVISDVSGDLLSQLVRPAPSLRSLEMVRFSPNEVQLPDNFLAGDVPLLRRLKLQFYHLKSWHNLDLSNIRFLVLIGNNPFMQPLLKSLLESLQTMQNLQYLELDSFRTSSNDIVTLDTTVTLSELENVKIRAPLSTCVSILNCITIPPKATVEVFGSLPGSGDSTMAFPIVSRLIKHTEGYEVKAVSLVTGSCFELKIFNQGLPYDYPSNAKAHLCIKFLYAPEAAVRRLVEQSLMVLPLSRLPALHIAVQDVLFVDDYLDYFSRLECLHTISVEGDCAYTLLEALGRNAEPPVMDDPVAGPSSRTLEYYIVPFPSLKTIIFWNVHFKKPADVFEELLKQLRYRSAKGAAIQKVAVREGVSFSEDHHQRLQEIVEVVEWDGQFVDDQDEDELEEEEEEEEDAYHWMLNYDDGAFDDDDDDSLYF